MDNMKKSICFPEGFLASGISCGIKKGKKKDLALVFSTYPCISSAVFTTNKVKSYSVIWSIKNIKNPIQAILANSGNANAACGKKGWDITTKIMEHLSLILNISSKNILFASTGLIGNPLPEKTIINSLEKIVKNLSYKNGIEAAESIITTDKQIKTEEITTSIAGIKKGGFVKLGAMAKGAGMINPNMATMLAFITTDAVISKELLQIALQKAVNDSFNMITIDNDQSTNDTVFCLANGQAGNKNIKENSEEFYIFSKALRDVCISLAKKIAKDGEGAKKFIEVSVFDAWSKKDAKRIAKKVAGSSLVKTAIAGAWSNWGRIMSSIGSARAKIEPANIKLEIGPYIVYNKEPIKFNDSELKQYLSEKEISIKIYISKGKENATAWGCDLTEEYIKINKKE
ncbi:MAG: bifunctional glutamate N-acetyltransferase/amino-acid acetyltransferase ArgJ [Candidatus Omnitrophica bacterium]|jgi:glutamate N-acetyltransferase/amino-acid N-acetyltransferase|nr:bifunctional glutamate N-acetyltransferase/amino-acid acetyltransferase ArgJ [Candidatus Omnitrophota bacterium]